MLLRNRIAIVVVGAGIAATSAWIMGTNDRAIARLVARGAAEVVRAPCRFDGAHFSVLQGLEVRGLEILDPADPFGAPLIAAESCGVNYVLDVNGFGPHVTSLDVRRPAVRLDRTKDGTLPLETVFELPASEGPRPPPPVVRLSYGTVSFSDPAIVRGDPLQLTDLTVTLAPATPKSHDWVGARVTVTATSDLVGAIRLDAVLGAEEGSGEAELDLPAIRVSPATLGHFAGDAARRAEAFAPEGALRAHVNARFAVGRGVVPRGTIDLAGVALTVQLPESDPGEPVPEPIRVTNLTGHLAYGDGRASIEGGRFEALGAAFEVDGAVTGIGGDDPRIEARAKVHALELTRELRRALPRPARRVAEAYDITGTVEASVTAAGALAAPLVTADAAVERGHVRFEGYPDDHGVRRGFPWDADDAAGTVKFDGRAIRIDATARHGGARVRATGVVDHPPGAGSVPDIAIVVDDVPLDGAVRAGFGERAPKVYDRWGPSGTAKRITVRVFRDPALDGQHDVTDVTIELDGRAGFHPELLPVDLARASGLVTILNPFRDGRRTEVVTLTKLAAAADGFDIEVSGEVVGENEDIALAVRTADASGPFRDAAYASPSITQGVKDAIRKLGASGPVRIDAALVKRGEARDDRVTIRLEGTSITGWDDIPLAAKGLTGVVSFADDTLTFDGIAGTFALDGYAPSFTGAGRLLRVSGDPEFDVHVTSPEIPLGEPLRTALGPLARQAHAFWDEVRPQGSARAALVLDLRPSSHAVPLELLLTDIHGALTPLGLELDNDGGSFHYDGRRAEIRDLSGAIGSAEVRIDEAIYDVATRRAEVRAGVRGLRFPEDLEGPLSAETVAAIADAAPNRLVHASDLRVVFEPDPRAVEIGGVMSIRPRVRRGVPEPGYAPEGTLAFERLVFWLPEDRPAYLQGEAKADAFSVRAGLDVDKLSGPVDFTGTLDGGLDLDVRLRGASLRVAGYPLSQCNARIRGGAKGIDVDARAAFMGGDFAASVSPFGNGGFRGTVRLAGGDLERLLRLRADPTKPVATGRIDGSAEFSNATGSAEDLRGSGSVTASQGKLMQTPGVTEVMRFVTLGMYTPVLTDAEMRYDLEGTWVRVRDVTVTGSGVNASITSGRGRIGFDGRLDMSLTARLELGVPIIEQIWRLLQTPIPRNVLLSGTLRNPIVRWGDRVRGADEEGRREPAATGEPIVPARDPW